uniref:FAD-binding domain-containing protein n=1 Tax=Glycine max TaxID=3847 RepID=A0A0R0HBU7_SOYBN
MATTTTTSPFVFLKCHTSPPCHTETLFTRTSYKAIKPQSQTDDVREEQVVVVGAGIADLATALSLHRLGVLSLVLEQAESLRTGGTSLTLFKNGWMVLDAIGAANDLRTQFLEIQGMVVKSVDGRELRAFNFKQEDQSQEVRAVERRVLLETLASQLPRDSVQYSSQLQRIEASPNGDTLLELVDGSKLLARIVIECDGIRSPIAKWMGFPEPKYVGLASYPDAQYFGPRVNYIYGRRLRAGFVPVSPTKVYWSNNN